MHDITIAIIAGGKSSRMGTDKAFVPLLGKAMISHVLEHTSDIGKAATILVVNQLQQYRHLGLPVFTDVFPNKGSLGGIFTALTVSQTNYILALACDMPFVNADLLRYMIALNEPEAGGPYEVVAPRVDGHPQGLHAIYSRACSGPIQARLEQDQLKVIGFYDQVRVRYLDAPEYAQIDPQGLSFRNINTPQELVEAEALLSEHTHCPDAE